MSNIKQNLSVFQNPNQFASVLLVAFVDHFGLDALLGEVDAAEVEKQQWSPHTISLELAQEIGHVLPENVDKLMTAVELIKTDNFYVSVPNFIRICNTLSDSPSNGQFDPAETDEIIWGILESMIITGELAQFSPEIKGYILEAVNQDGLSSLPATIKLAVPEYQDAFNTGIADDTVDTDMFDMATGVAESTAEEISTATNKRLNALVRDLLGLRLNNAASSNWVESVIDELQNMHKLTDNPV